jgi:hypothetical protein
MVQQLVQFRKGEPHCLNEMAPSVRGWYHVASPYFRFDPRAIPPDIFNFGNNP